MPFVTFRKKLKFYGEELSAPRPTPKLGDHPLSVVRDCLCNIFAAILHIWRPSPPSATWGRAMPWWQGTHLTLELVTASINKLQIIIIIIIIIITELMLSIVIVCWIKVLFLETFHINSSFCIRILSDLSPNHVSSHYWSSNSFS
jgi:hypothetical protein